MQTNSAPRPSFGTKTGRIWEIADEITRETGRIAKRQAVIDAFRKEGGNPNTASTQYSQWHAYKKANPQTINSDFFKNELAIQLVMGRDGRILIPIELRERMALKGEALLNVTLKNGELIITTPKSALEALRNIISQTDNSTTSIVSELLEDRRLEKDN